MPPTLLPSALPAACLPLLSPPVAACLPPLSSLLPPAWLPAAVPPAAGSTSRQWRGSIASWGVTWLQLNWLQLCRMQGCPLRAALPARLLALQAAEAESKSLPDKLQEVTAELQELTRKVRAGGGCGSEDSEGQGEKQWGCRQMQQ